MYNCNKCGRTVASGQEQLTVVSETREVEYTEQVTGRDGKPRLQFIGSGTEIVREQKLCRTCYGLEELEEPKPVRSEPVEYKQFEFELVLANGKRLRTNRAEELEHFLESGGFSIDGSTPRRKGGKSKGARGRGRKVAKQPRSER